MSDTDLADAPGVLAGEYVLGVLEADEADAARRRIETDQAFAAEVRQWERELMPLTSLVAPAAPPADLWERIEASIGKPPASAKSAAVAPKAANDNSVGFWRTTALAAMAVAAGLAAFIALRPAPQPLVAVLLPMAGSSPVVLAVARASGGYMVRETSAIPVAADRDLELWSLKAGESKPAPLGVIPPGGSEIPAALPAGTQLLISVEPKGGSPTGLPTGPVIYGGKLTQVE